VLAYARTRRSLPCLRSVRFYVVEEDVGSKSPALAYPEPKLPYVCADLRELACKAAA